MSDDVRCKGRFIKKKELSRREKVREANIARSRRSRDEVINETRAEVNKAYPAIDGNRIVNIQVLAKNLYCNQCNIRLGLDRIVEETRIGLMSTFIIECDACKKRLPVQTGVVHEVNSDICIHLKDKKHNDLTAAAVLGTIDGGMGLTELNKLLACCDIPTISSNTYKRYEKEVGAAIEEEARLSCKRAAAEERQLVLENLAKLHNELPEEIKADFFNELLNASEAHDNNNSNDFDRAAGEIVNIICSYDMGWSKRGNGRSYDSLNGYGALIGFFSKKILDYRTRNRKCFSCALGIAKDKHDCRQNFFGSAKSMEADAGADLITNSTILKEAKLNAMIIIGDEDSSLMAAVRKKAPTKKFHKLADRNHLKVNLGKKLYQLQAKHSELKKKGFISHIKMCFGYAVAQNKGQSRDLAEALRCIPAHLYNIHDSCGSWCSTASGEIDQQQRYKIKSHDLYIDLVELFDNFASNSHKYSIPASSQANESLNQIITVRFPKNKNYSTSISGDVRVASGVLAKNEGPHYLIKVKERIGIPVLELYKKFINKLSDTREKKKIKAASLEQKKRRLELKNEREKLKLSMENKEGVMYEKNMGFQLDEISVAKDDCCSVIFDLETSGFGREADILQIGAVCGDKKFSVYIQPTQSIDDSASKVTGLKAVEGNLYLNGKLLITLPLVEALNSFLSFLQSFGKSCLMIAHNASFDMRFLVRDIIRNSMVNDFYQVMYGFCDTLKILKKIMPERKGKGMFSLSVLTKDLLKNNNNVDNEITAFHDAEYDVTVLQKLVDCYISFEILRENICKFMKAIYNYQNRVTGNNRKIGRRSVLKVKLLEEANCEKVIFKLETSNQSKSAEILHLVAICGDIIFSTYMQPIEQIHKTVTEKDGFKIVDGSLQRYDEILAAVSVKEAFQCFSIFLQNLGKPCLLLGYDICDIHLFIRELVQCNLVEEFDKVLYGICNVLPIIRKQRPECKSKDIKNLIVVNEKQVVQDAMLSSPHEALCNVDILQNYVNESIPFSLLLSKKNELKNLTNKYTSNINVSCRKKDFAPLENIISNYMLKKMAASFDYIEMKRYYDEMGEVEFLNFYSNVVDGKPRLTKDKEILQNIADHFKSVQ